MSHDQDRLNQANKMMGKGVAKGLKYGSRKLGQFAFKKAVGTGLTFAFKAILIKTAPIWGGFLLVCFLILFVQIAVVEIPKMIAQDAVATSTDKVSGFFSFGGDEEEYIITEEDAEEFFEEYEEQAEKWKDDLTEEQITQATPYALSWGVLAGTDRIVNDPYFNPEKKDNEGIEITPEQTFEDLKPEFKWKESEEIHRWEEKVCRTTEDGDRVCWWEDRKKIVEVTLLTNAYTYSGDFEHEYEWETFEVEKNDPDIRNYTIEKEVVKQIHAPSEEEYMKPYEDYLKEKGANNEDDIDLVYEILSAYDEQFRKQYAYQNNIVYPAEIEGMFINPVPSGYTTSEFGMRWGRMHYGLDFGSNRRPEPIYAVAAGQVVREHNIYRDRYSSYGNYIIIQHQIGDQVYETLYAHNTTNMVKVGDMVEQGEQIALTGTTGSSTGIHLHFEVHQGHWNGSKSYAIDPRPLLSGLD